MYKLIVILLFFIAYSLAWNYYSYSKCKSLYGSYKKYLDAMSSKAKYEGDIYSKKIEIIRLFDRAGVSHLCFPDVSFAGYGNFARQIVDPLDNLFNIDERIVGSVMLSFESAIGEYHQRMLNSINPLYWIRTLIFLPRTIFEYLGVKPDSVIVKLFQIIYWILNVIYAVYSDRINPLIQSLLSNLFK